MTAIASLFSTPWYRPPTAPGACSAPQAAAGDPAAPVKEQSQTTGSAAPQANSDGANALSGGTSVSPRSEIVTAFLLQLQEMGAGSFKRGTDGADNIDVWSNSTVEAGEGDDVVHAWSDSAVDGGGGNDTIDIWSGSKADGGGGDDRISAWSDSYVNGGDGNDVIDVWSDAVADGGTGNDVITGWSGAHLSGGAGDDALSVWSDGIADGGDGNDVISVAAATAIGGKGDDTIHASNSTVKFAAGDGQDTIVTMGAVTIDLGAGLSADQMQLTIDGTTAKVSFGDGSDALTIKLNWQHPTRLAFADGTVTDVVPTGERPAPPDLSDGKVVRLSDLIEAQA